jgi:hypothetical protein
MEYNKDKVDEMALALLFLASWQEQGVTRAWKGIAWEILDRIHEKGLISDPKSKAKSIVLSEEGARLTRELFEKHFCSPA